MTLNERVWKERERIREVARRHGVQRIYVFGSVARGEATTDSDLDLMIEAEGPTPPWFPGGLVAELQQLLGCRVDVVESRSLNPWLRETILREARPL